MIQRANDPKAVEQLQLGGIDFTVSGSGTYATHIPTLNLTVMPFLVETYAQGWKFYDESKWLQAQFAKGPEKGVRFVSNFEAGFRSITTKDPIRTPADAKGKKLRTFPNANLAIALYTPPVGGTLFVAAKLANAGIGAITRALIPFMGATVAVLFLVTYWPALTRWLPSLLY